MHPRNLSIADFTYVLPEDRIAQQPLVEREASRLLHFKDGRISDHVFRELPDLLPPNALVVLNNTRVVNARLVFHRDTGARIEVLCLEPADGRPVEQAFLQQGSCMWNTFVGNAKRWKVGEELVLDHYSSVPEDDDRTSASVLTLRAIRTAPERIAFTWEPSSYAFAEVLDRLGHVPLPPYMHRPDDAADKERYNTVFARHEGSVAAPTASLHFSPELLKRMQERGIATTELTLHVGAGTFLPVKSERMADHVMHGEEVRIPLAALEKLADQLGQGPVVAVGTTALRTLESIYWHGVMVMQGRAGSEMTVGQWEPYDHAPEQLPTQRVALQGVIDRMRQAGEDRLVGSTRILIAPGYTFRYVDALVTNFHQPQSTLLLLVDAFIGEDRCRVYDHALATGYRFLSYGDGSLLWRSL